MIRRPYEARQGVSALQTSLVLSLTLSLGTELFKHGDGAPQDLLPALSLGGLQTSLVFNQVLWIIGDGTANQL